MKHLAGRSRTYVWRFPALDERQRDPARGQARQHRDALRYAQCTPTLSSIWNRLTSSGKVAARWAGLASDDFVRNLERLSWVGIPQVHLNHNFLITGSRDVYWVDWIRGRYFPDDAALDALSLGCGAGHLDRIMKRCGFNFRSFTGIDVSAPAVDQARQLAHEVHLASSIDYFAADLNRHVLKPASYDFIYFFQSLHHIEALEHALEECRRALRPGGWLMINEFVGPTRFQWTDAQIEAANRALQKIPVHLRRDLIRGGLKTEVVRPTVREMKRYDPSEAVRSGDIESALRTLFHVTAEWSWGGTINHLVFQNIAGNFVPDRAEDRELIEQLIADENAMIRDGALPSDFKVFLARAN